MIEAIAQVVAIEESGYAWVETKRRMPCGHCASNQRCSCSWLVKLIRRQHNRVKAINSIGSQTGDHVTIGIHETALLKGAFSIYGVPLLAMIGMALLGDALTEGAVYQGGGDIIFGLCGLGLGLVWLRYFAKRMTNDIRYLPVILRRIPKDQMYSVISPLA